MRIITSTNVPSPCINDCCLNDADMCMGCFRLLEEILIWGDADSPTRLEILERVEWRKNCSK